MQELYDIAKQMLTPKKGILASDESTGSANKALQKVNMEPTEQNRIRYRDMIYNTPELENYVSGIIISEETIEQNDVNGKPFVDVIKEKGILVGVKLDKGLVDMPNFQNEKITQGLDGLAERVEKYKNMGASFAKWRAVIKISDSTPTQENLEATGFILAMYAAICQKGGIVPIIEPEVLHNGKHTIEQAQEVTTRTIKVAFEQLKKYKVDIKGLVLKTSMVLEGKESYNENSHEDIAKATVQTLSTAVPADIGGVVFLSGGQAALEATQNLNEIAKLEPLPFELAFSFLRAIQGPALEYWHGDDNNLTKAREILIQRLQENTLADQGKFME